MPNTGKNDGSAAAWETQLRKGLLEYVVVLVLSRGDAYGYDLVRQLRDRAGLDVAEGTLYPILRRLQADGALESEWKDNETGVPRKYYHLTAQGKVRLGNMRSSWAELVMTIERLSLRKTNQ